MRLNIFANIAIFTKTFRRKVNTNLVIAWYIIIALWGNFITRRYIQSFRDRDAKFAIRDTFFTMDILNVICKFFYIGKLWYCAPVSGLGANLTGTRPGGRSIWPGTRPSPCLCSCMKRFCNILYNYSRKFCQFWHEVSRREIETALSQSGIGSLRDSWTWLSTENLEGRKFIFFKSGTKVTIALENSQLRSNINFRKIYEIYFITSQEKIRPWLYYIPLSGKYI